MIEDNLSDLLTAERGSIPGAVVLRALSEKGSLTSAQIARETGLARSTVSTAVTALRKSGFVIEAETAEGGARAIGRPGTLLMLNPDAGTCVGVHLALDGMKVAIADVSHSVIVEADISLPVDYAPARAAAILKDWIDTAYGDNGLRRSGLLGVGVSVSAPVAEDGTIHHSSMVPAWAGVNVVEIFGTALGALVLADNESNCSAIAEHMWGAARGHDDFVLFKMNYGVGGAIVIDGKLRSGIAGGAGEFGHISLDPEGDLCRCGNRGCLELSASLLRPMAELARAHGRAFTIRELVDLARRRDPSVLRLVADLAEAGGRGLAMIGGVLNPPLIVVSGFLAQTGDVLLQPMTAAFEKFSLLKTSSLPVQIRTRIVAGELQDNDVVLGAIGLVLRHYGRNA